MPSSMPAGCLWGKSRRKIWQPPTTLWTGFSAWWQPRRALRSEENKLREGLLLQRLVPGVPNRRSPATQSAGRIAPPTHRPARPSPRLQRLQTARAAPGELIRPASDEGHCHGRISGSLAARVAGDPVCRRRDLIPLAAQHIPARGNQVRNLSRDLQADMSPGSRG